ncbi:MAG: efflux RND transporter periplasmic adaptor subunit [Candidatus Binatus sp.]|jgi:multidrug efflux system membrane fusion protein|uniref:efflux RND transporter periplasmic adaptor subunit n=1 Tax=Candidatus Binatus sp. TaxID=2811406 RepID=UPI003C765E0C
MLQRLLKLILLAAFAIGAYGCAPDDPPAPPRIAVTVLTVSPGEAAAGSEAYTASLQPYQQVSVAFQVSGYVNSIKQVTGADGRMREIQGGDLVKAHELLATATSDTYQDLVSQSASALASAQASYVRAKQDFDRDSTLLKQQVIAQATYDQASQVYQSAGSQVEESQAALRQAQVKLDYCKLTSPMDGVVLDRHIEVGSLVEPATVALEVADLSDMKAVFGVSDMEVGELKQGSSQTLSAEALPGVPLIGKITSVAPNADLTTRTFDVEVTVPNKDGKLRSGMIASLQIAATGTPAVSSATLPLNAIVRPPNDRNDFAVYVVEDHDGKSFARLRRVDLGEIVGNEITVSKGVNIGDRVIMRGATMVSEGAEVRVMP